MLKDILVVLQDITDRVAQEVVLTVIVVIEVRQDHLNIEILIPFPEPDHPVPEVLTLVAVQAAAAVIHPVAEVVPVHPVVVEEEPHAEVVIEDKPDEL